MSDALRSLGNFARRLARAHRLEDLVWKLAESIGTDFGFPDCVIYLLEGGILRQAAAYGEKNPTRREIKEKIEIPIGRGITGRAAAQVRSQRVDDVREDPSYIPDVFAGLSELAVPIVYADQVLGVIDSEADEVAFYGEQEQNLLEIIADMMAPRIAAALEAELRRGVEVRLAASRERYRALVDSIEGIVWEAEPETLEFRFVSRQAGRLLGESAARWIEKRNAWLEAVHPEDREKALELRRRVADTGESRVAIYRMTIGDDRVRWFRESVSLGTGTRGEAALHGLLVEITDQRSA